MREIFVVPGMGTIHCFYVNNHANAFALALRPCAGLLPAPYRFERLMTSCYSGV